jgi:gas vesicle protein
MSENGGEIGAFMAGFVIGGFVGAATAIILAPQSGEETRAQIAAKGDEWRQSGEEHLQEYRTYAESTVGDVQERARIVLDEGKSRVSKKQEQDEEPETETAEESASGEDDGEQAS